MLRFCIALVLVFACLDVEGMMTLPGMHSVGRKGTGGGPLSRDLPFAGNGTCEEAVTAENGITTVRCLGPEQPMLPGTTLDAYILLANPYPVGKEVTVLRQEAQLVAKTGHKSWRPVPLSELYLHHVVPNPKFLQGEGAEIRGSSLRKEFSAPYAYIVNGSETEDLDVRLTNIQLVNTKGVAPANLQMSYECWCDTEAVIPPEHNHTATRGSLFCCTQRPTTSYDAYEIYQLEYNITFRDVKKDEKRIGILGLDVTGGRVEYNIPEPMGPGTNHTVARETAIDEICPQSGEFEIVRCTAHSHIGSKGMTVYAMDGTVICRSIPIYGTEKGAPGNELDYVVAISDDNLDPPYKIKPGTKVRVESVYDGSQKRLGVMGIIGFWIHGPNVTDCNPGQPPKTDADALGVVTTA